MTQTTTAPYGSWRSPITSDLIVAETIRLEQVRLAGDAIYWVEMRPAEGGRYVVVRRDADGTTADVTPPGFNVRTRVHEYGGGAYTVDAGSVYFANYADQRLYRQPPGGTPEPLTPEGPWRYADMAIDRARGRLICVLEYHGDASREPLNSVAEVPLAGGAPRVLVAGNDFYSTPRLDPGGARLVWLTWNHPNMPWDGCELWLADIGSDGSPQNARLVAGGLEESIYQPAWSPDGSLHFVSDRTGWWNLYRLRESVIEPVWPMAAEFGAPQWGFANDCYAFADDERIVCRYVEQAICRLGCFDAALGRFEPFELPYVRIEYVRAAPGSAVFVAASSAEAPAVVRLDLASGAVETLRRSSAVEVDPGYLSAAEPIEFPTEGGRTAFGFFYPPRNRDYAAPAGERPPLIVKSHGGPTGQTFGGLDLPIQFWTSRGFAVLDVNYGGSTGFGRPYRERLKGQWGIVDVDDCVNGARFLARTGAVDPRRLAITGGSAGGYTTLAALTFRNVFRAGASYYGVADLEALARDTHKFESRYLDALIGPYPERRDLYRARSPIDHADRISAPVIFFQGLEDRVVPPAQAERMVAALRAKGLPVAYLPFEGEQHGFRRAENIKRALENELAFYARVFRFESADPVDAIPIENLPAG